MADLPAMRAFYRDVLGFPVFSEMSFEGAENNPDGEPTISFLTIAEVDSPLGRHGHPQVLVLRDNGRHTFGESAVPWTVPERSRLHHLAFEVPPGSLDEHARHLEATASR